MRSVPSPVPSRSSRPDPVGPLALILALALAFTGCGGVRGTTPSRVRPAVRPPPAGLALGPALILLRDVVPGQTVHLGEVAGVVHGMANHGDEAQEIRLRVVVPECYDFRQFECGYEPPSSGDWFSLARGGERAPAHLLHLAPGTREGAALVITIPDRPDCWNRHFVVYVEGAAPATSPLGVSLGVRGRVLVETAVRPVAAAAVPQGGPIAVAPSLAVMARGDGGRWRATVRLANHDAVARRFVLVPVDQVYPGAEVSKAHRLFAGIPHAVLTGPWATPDPPDFVLGPGRARNVTFTAAVDRTPEPGGWSDELVFIGRLALPDAPAPETGATRTVAGRTCDRLELLRLRYQTPAVEEDRQ